MDKSTVDAKASSSAAVGYLSWEEVFVSSNRGRREVHYLLKRKDGRSDLAVVGNEKSLRHMSYNYAIQNLSFLTIGAKSRLVKLKSRREVIDWLNSVISDACPDKSSYSIDSSLDGSEDLKLSSEDQKDFLFQSNGHCTREIIWLGSATTCRKKRRHYQSFYRNGAKISVHDFVFVLAEEDKQLIAYLEDMYEDYRGNKMVVVRWFHKIDEVGIGIVLPNNYNDREIFFSLSHQDLSIECIDGLASVLGPQDFEKFLEDIIHPELKPFVCCKLFENDVVKPFDITQVDGYWKQELLIYMYPPASHSSDYGEEVAKIGNGSFGPRLRKRLRRLSDVCVPKNRKSNYVQCKSSNLIECGVGTEICNLQGGSYMKEVTKESPQQCLTVCSEVEVLSQDSGIRGCWFRGLIIKKHKDKVKVRYQDIQDAADEANKLEEWILASKVAIPDELGFRIFGRTIVRPIPQCGKAEVSWIVSVGTAVDAWWHDGWWEGIVVEKESNDRVHVYLPGEKSTSIFGVSELRRSQEWLGNSWIYVKERADLASSIPRGLKTDHVLVGKSAKADGRPPKEEAGFNDSNLCSSTDNQKEDLVAPYLHKSGVLAQLKWNSCKKRRRSSGSSAKKMQPDANNSTRKPKMEGPRYGNFFVADSVRVDNENCKYIWSLFSSKAAPPLTSLVMSR